MRKLLLNALLCVTIFGFLTSVPAAASEAQGKIWRVYVTRQGVAMFHLDGPARTGLPACASRLPTRWAFNAKTPEGQAMLSFILTAYASGKEVLVVGQNACPDWTDTESVELMFTM